MTKDSICKDCEHRVEVSGSFTQKVTRKITTDFLHRWCKVSAINEDDLNPDIHRLRVLKCSEFSRRDKPPYKIPPPDPRRFQVIEDTRRKCPKKNSRTGVAISRNLKKLDKSLFRLGLSRKFTFLCRILYFLWRYPDTALIILNCEHIKEREELLFQFPELKEKVFGKT